MLDSMSPSFWEFLSNVLGVITILSIKRYLSNHVVKRVENLFRKLCEEKHLPEVADHVYEHGCGHDDDDENDDKHDCIVN